MAVAAMTMAFTGCVSYKNVPYFQNADSISYAASRGLHSVKIMPKDVLSVNVTTSDREVSSQFNQLTYNTMQNGNRNISSGSGSLMPYTVDNDGTINFPIIGRIKVQGMTRRECEDKIASLIKPYLSTNETPSVVVEIQSFNITVLGEVSSPGVKSINSEKYSILQAIGAAGDLTIYGKRNNVLLIREDENGQKSTHRLNLNDANIINSPYFYVQQNDVVYVEPNKAKARNSDIGNSTSLWFSATSIVISLASLLYNILK